MKQIDTKLTTTSMKLVDEKSLLRRKGVVKARLKELAGFEALMEEIHALKVSRLTAVGTGTGRGSFLRYKHAK